KGARPLFVYVKKQHVGVVPGIDKFVNEYVSAKAMSKDGYLARKGLVALPKAEFEKVASTAKAMKPLTAAEVK
ncbi:MAG: phosphate ABC transporter substrate-binding protein, partial [Methylibium sp.]